MTLSNSTVPPESTTSACVLLIRSGRLLATSGRGSTIRISSHVSVGPRDGANQCAGLRRLSGVTTGGSATRGARHADRTKN